MSTGQPKDLAIRPEDYKAMVPGVVAMPMQEVRQDLQEVGQGRVNKAGFVREGFSEECESGLNKMCNLAMNVRFITQAMQAYFDRDAVALPGIAKYFGGLSSAAMRDALDLLDYVNMRGGRVILKTVPMPDSEYAGDQDKGDALCAFELALALGKLKFTKLRELHATARKEEDAEMQDFINGKLHEQALLNKELGNYVCELRRVGKGHGTFHFDRRIEKRHGHVLSATLHLPTAV